MERSRSTLCAAHFLYAVGAFPAGALADRFGKRRFLLTAYTLAAVMNLLLILAIFSITLVFVFVLAGAGDALQQSLERAIAPDIIPVKSAAPASARSRPPTASEISYRARSLEHCGQRFPPRLHLPMRSF